MDCLNSRVVPSIFGNILWVEKYRPNKISEILDQDISVQAIKGLLKNKSLPHLLFHGPSGTGKTTLLRLIGGQLVPDHGEVLLDGKDIAQMSRQELFAARARMGMLFQSGALFTDMSVYENFVKQAVESKKKSEH